MNARAWSRSKLQRLRLDYCPVMYVITRSRNSIKLSGLFTCTSTGDYRSIAGYSYPILQLFSWIPQLLNLLVDVYEYRVAIKNCTAIALAAAILSDAVSDTPSTWRGAAGLFRLRTYSKRAAFYLCTLYYANSGVDDMTQTKSTCRHKP